MAGNPVPNGILQQGASEDKGEVARMVSPPSHPGGWGCLAPGGAARAADPPTPAALQSSFVGAMAIADVVKSTLGPKGMVRTPCCQV